MTDREKGSTTKFLYGGNMKRVKKAVEPEMSEADMKRALDVDPTKCFLCQENPPTHLCRSSNGKTLLCEGCATFCDNEARRREQIARSLVRNDRTKLFQYTLGLDPNVRFSFEIVGKLE